MTNIFDRKHFMTRLLQSEAALLAAIPFVGSFIAFVFEAGYLSFFDVPISVVQLDFTRVVTASAIVALVLALFYLLFIFMAVVFAAAGPHPLRQVFLKPLVNAFIFGIFFYLASVPSSWWWFLAGYLVLLVALELLPPAFNGKIGTTYLERLTSQHAEDETGVHDGMKEKERDSLFDRAFMLISVLFFCSAFVYAIGHHHAQTKTTYWVMLDDPQKLLVENYGGFLIIKTFNPMSKQIGDRLTLTKLNDSSPIVLRKIYTGELVAAKRKGGV